MKYAICDEAQLHSDPDGAINHVTTRNPGGQNMDSNDLLKDNRKFAIEKMVYHNNVSMSRTHYHSHYEILYIQSGERKIIVNNMMTYDLNYASIALLPPNSIHQTLSNDASQTRILVNISPALIEEIVAFASADILSCFEQTVLPLSRYDIGILNDCFEQLLSARVDSPLYEETVKIITAHLLLHLSNIRLANVPTCGPMIDSKIKNNMSRLLQYMQQNYSSDITLSSLSSLIHVSEEYLVRCFKMQFDMTPMKYLGGLRIANAKRLLESNTMSVSNVAAACGYNSNTSFTRAFKQQTGMSPKEYQLAIRFATRS